MVSRGRTHGDSTACSPWSLAGPIRLRGQRWCAAGLSREMTDTLCLGQVLLDTIAAINL
jgi:hypothetical protein